MSNKARLWLGKLQAWWYKHWLKVTILGGFLIAGALFFNGYILLGTSVTFFSLSFILAWVIDKLPIWCQSSWFLISVYGIACVGTATGIIDPTAWPVIHKMAVIFFASLFGMAYLDYLQKRSRVSYWEREGLPEGMQGRVVYLSDLIDRFVWWWTRRKINEMADEDLLIDECRYPDDNGVHIDKHME